MPPSRSLNIGFPKVPDDDREYTPGNTRSPNDSEQAPGATTHQDHRTMKFVDNKINLRGQHLAQHRHQSLNLRLCCLVSKDPHIVVASLEPHFQPLTRIIVQETHSHHPILHILQATNLRQQPVTIHVATPKPIGRPTLDRLNELLTPDATDSKTNHRHPQVFVGRRLADDGDTVICVQKIQKDLLQSFLVGCHLSPGAAGVGSKERHYARNALGELVVS